MNKKLIIALGLAAALTVFFATACTANVPNAAAQSAQTVQEESAVSGGQPSREEKAPNAASDGQTPDQDEQQAPDERGNARGARESQDDFRRACPSGEDCPQDGACPNGEDCPNNQSSQQGSENREQNQPDSSASQETPFDRGNAQSPEESGQRGERSGSGSMTNGVQGQAGGKNCGGACLNQSSASLAETH